MKKMLMSLILIGMLTLGITTNTENSMENNTPYSEFQVVHYLQPNEPRPDNLGFSEKILTSVKS